MTFSEPELIDSKAIKSLVEAHALGGAIIQGQPGGWAVLVRYGNTERFVGGQRTHRMRLWRNINTAIGFVRDELGMKRFEVDTVHHAPEVNERRRPDAAARLKRALSYDDWARRDIELALKQADDPAIEWLDHEDAMAELTAIIVKARTARAPTRG